MIPRDRQGRGGQNAISTEEDPIPLAGESDIATSLVNRLLSEECPTFQSVRFTKLLSDFRRLLL